MEILKIASNSAHTKWANNFFVLIIAIMFCATAQAKTLTFAIQPVLPKADIEKAYQPLADYLAKATGHDIAIVGSSNFSSYWQVISKKTGSYDLILDAAHFTDFRVQTQNYSVVAKIPDTVSYTLITQEETLVLDEEELIGKKLATVPSPSLGGVRLEKIYPNVLRQPDYIPTNNFRDALTKVQSGEVVAAIIPTPLVRGAQSVNSVFTTDPVPHMAFSVSPAVDSKITKAIKKALLAAKNTPEGKKMLEKINFPSFEPASEKTYQGFASLLDGVWGYELLSQRK